MALNSLNIGWSCINYFRPGINSAAFFHEVVRLLIAIGAIRPVSRLSFLRQR